MALAITRRHPWLLAIHASRTSLGACCRGSGHRSPSACRHCQLAALIRLVGADAGVRSHCRQHVSGTETLVHFCVSPMNRGSFSLREEELFINFWIIRDHEVIDFPHPYAVDPK